MFEAHRIDSERGPIIDGLTIFDVDDGWLL